MTASKFGAWRNAIAIVSVAGGAALLLLPFTSPNDVPLFFLFVGRLHPLVLHFPIVLSLLALLIEIFRHFLFRAVSPLATEIVLGAAALSSWVTIGAGYFLYASGEYAGEIIMQHFWAGILAGMGHSVSLAVLLYYHTTQRLYVVFVSALLLTNLCVAYASHLGGSVTHGSEYLVEYLNMMRAEDRENARTDSELLMYADVVAPVLEARCVSCHNSQRAKGGLAMDGYAELFGAGDSNLPAIVRGSLAKSEAITRMHLPTDHDEHMPPAGKSPVTDDELTLLTYWISQGASDTARVWPARGNDTLRASLERLLPELRKYQLRAAANREREASALVSLTELSPTLGLHVERDSLSEANRLRLITAVPPKPVTSEIFRELAPYYPFFSQVSLVSSGVEDDQLYYLAQMVNVHTLLLQKNAIDGSGLVYLAGMPHLEVLNLSYSRVDDRHALELLKFPELKKVYLYRTNVSPDVIKAIKRYRPGLEILEEEGPYL